MSSDSGTLPAANAIASWSATTGLTEAARRAVFSLLDAGVEIAIEDYDFGAPTAPGRFPERFRSLRQGRPHRIDLCFLNVNEIQNMDEPYLRRPGAKSYVIGSWYWELPSVPDHIVTQLKRVDEIWVASEFVRQAFTQYVETPITVMPALVEPVAARNFDLAEFGVAEGACTYFFNFDANSTLARKNPLGLVEAFRRTFSKFERGTSAYLVLKSINLAALGDAQRRVREEVASVGGVLIEDELSAGEMAALIASCDIYVSLHRAEGFGLGLAEAMYFGRPVIATSYSGNADFTTAHNSCPVTFRLRAIDGGELWANPGAEVVYKPGLLWAEPSLDDAVRWMRYLYEHPEARRRIGEAGARTIRERYSSAAAGAAMAGRLVEVQRRLERAGRHALAGGL